MAFLHLYFPSGLCMATHSSTLARRIPGTGEPGGLQSIGSHRVRHDWSDLAAAAAGCLVILGYELLWFSLICRHPDGLGMGCCLQERFCFVNLCWEPGEQCVRGRFNPLRGHSNLGAARVLPPAAPSPQVWAPGAGLEAAFAPQSPASLTCLPLTFQILSFFVRFSSVCVWSSFGVCAFPWICRIPLICQGTQQWLKTYRCPSPGVFCMAVGRQPSKCLFCHQLGMEASAQLSSSVSSYLWSVLDKSAAQRALLL